MKIDEYGNKVAPEINSQTENKSFKENVVFKENKAVLENVNVVENKEFDGKSSGKTAKKDKRSRAMSVMSTSLIGVVGLVVAGLTNLVNVKFKAKFNEVEYRDGQIVYSLNVSDMTEKEYLRLYPERDAKKLDAIELVDEDGDGYIEGSFEVDHEYIEKQLASSNNVSIRYTLNLRGMVGLDVERLFDRYVVKIDKFTSIFHNVKGYCNCGVDGYYYFTMNFEDDGGQFTDFVAYIIDSVGNRADCEFTDNLHDEQRIFVSNLQGSKGRLHIEYKENDSPVSIKGADGLDGIEIDM